MNASRKTLTALLLALLLALPAFGVTACKKRSPMEKAGDSMRDAGNNIGDAVEDAATDAKRAARDATN